MDRRSFFAALPAAILACCTSCAGLSAFSARASSAYEADLATSTRWEAPGGPREIKLAPSLIRLANAVAELRERLAALEATLATQRAESTDQTSSRPPDTPPSAGPSRPDRSGDRSVTRAAHMLDTTR